MSTKDPLLNLFVTSVPESFLQRISDRQPALYREAWEQANDPSWEEQERRYIEPHLRRILMEAELRQAAEDQGFRSFNLPHAASNCDYVLVKAGRIILTAHQVSRSGESVRPCVSRKQNAGVNRWLDELPLEGVLREPLPSLETGASILAYLIHGRFRVQRKEEEPLNLFMRIAIPESGDLTRYIRNWSIDELMGAYVAMRSDEIPATEDLVTPRVRQKREEGNIA